MWRRKALKNKPSKDWRSTGAEQAYSVIDVPAAKHKCLLPSFYEGAWKLGTMIMCRYCQQSYVLKKVQDPSGKLTWALLWVAIDSSYEEETDAPWWGEKVQG
jgi:hypothetical protein